MNIMAKKTKEEKLVGYLDLEFNHKKKTNDIKFILIQAKRLGLVGKHAGSKPIDRLKRSLKRASKQLAALSNIKNILNKKTESSLIVNEK